MSEYKQLINAYLRSKGVGDITKYDISIRQGGLHYDRWEYAVGIHKPTGLVLPKQVSHTTSSYYFTLVFKHANNYENEDNTTKQQLKPKFAVGDHVRIYRYKTHFEKGLHGGGV